MTPEARGLDPNKWIMMLIIRVLVEKYSVQRLDLIPSGVRVLL